MHCPAIGATGVPIDFSNNNNLKSDLRHIQQVVGGSNPLAPTIKNKGLPGIGESFFMADLQKVILQVILFLYFLTRHQATTATAAPDDMGLRGALPGHVSGKVYNRGWKFT